MDAGFAFGVVVGVGLGGASVWYFKVRSLQAAVLAVTGQYRKAERGRKILEERNRQ